ncbi:PhnD/SsuA/transferrin family substrate-binding protein [Methylotuvimicrobium sp. KM1]|uniref:PhnD/SsuA/transferrin family substrate-binding protein n=1 Tax=Methylotuvimicrobium sp. KM1 TaxID=3377707 RepID=UPI00384F86C9
MLLLRLIILSLSSILLLTPSSVAADDTVRIGVLANRGKDRALVEWLPTAEYLASEISSRNFSIVPLDFNEIDKAVASGEVDFFLVNSGIYVDFEARYGAGRIATMRKRNGGRGNTFFSGVIFTRADREDINQIADLKGKRFAAVSESSLGGYLAAWREMQAQGVTPEKHTRLSFLNTHDATVRAVLDGSADAGTARSDTLEQMHKEGAIDLKELKVINPIQHENFSYLSSTRLYPEWPFAKLADTSESLSLEVASALMLMSIDSSAAQAAGIAGWTVAYNYRPVHDLLRELRLSPYEEIGRIGFDDFLRHYWHWLLLSILTPLVLSLFVVYFIRLNSRLRKTESELIDARDHLAVRVRERTAELEESRRQLELISQDWNDAFDAIGDPIFIHDAAMRIVRANPAYCDRAGMTLKQVIGRIYFELFPKLNEPMPACRNFPEASFAKANELQLPNGDIFVSRSFGIIHADRSSKSAIHILEDVTELRKTEARRRILNRALEQAGEGIMILDCERRVIFCNPSLRALLGCDSHEPECNKRLFNKGDCLLVTAYFMSQLQSLFDKAERDGEGFSAEMELNVPNGLGLPVFITVAGILNENDEQDGFVLTVLDLSEVKQAEQALTYRIGLEALIAGIASNLSNARPEQINQTVLKTLAQLGRFLDVDRAYIFDYDDAEDAFGHTHEWCEEGVEPQIDSLCKFKVESFPWLFGELMNGRTVKIEDVNRLPSCAIPEREEFVHENIFSLLLAPFNYGGVFSGFIGVDSVRRFRRWNEEEERLLQTAGEMIINTLRRIDTMNHLRVSETNLAAAQQIAHLGSWEWNIVTDELSWSDEVYRMFGFKPQQFVATYRRFLELISLEDRGFVADAVQNAFSRGDEYELDHRIRRADGVERVLHEIGEVIVNDAGEPVRMIGTVQDVTELRQAEHEMRRLNRALRTLSLCNTTLVHAQQEQTLMNDICRILIDSGGYRFAWVGYAEHDDRKTIRPMAFAGGDFDFITSAELSWADDAGGRNPAAYAIRNKETFILKDIVNNSHDFAPSWREGALGYGYASVIALPLISDGETLGAITLDSAEPDAFDQAELRLLEEMAGDLAFGIRALRIRQEREHAESVLKIAENRYEELYENAPNAYVSVAPQNGVLLQFNQSLCEMLGYDRAFLETKTIFDLFGGTQIGKLFAGEQSVCDIELNMHRADGDELWVSLSIDPIKDEAGCVAEYRASLIDISVRKQAEEEQQRFAEKLQGSLIQTIRAIAMTIEKRDPYTAGHQERVAELAVQIGRRMGFDAYRLEGLRLGATIHDIGKIAVPIEILNRPGKLEPMLFTIIKSHPSIGYEIVKGIEFPWPIAEMVVQHHERLDGTGYPHGLKGDEILMESRILAVSDVVEAMASHRPYRAALGVQAALSEIERGKGTIYDASVVGFCREVFESGGTPWE